MKPNEYYIDIDFWQDHCVLVWPVNRADAEEWYKQRFPLREPEEFSQLEDSDAISYCGDTRIIFIKKWEFNSENIGRLAHECVHIANHILADKGVKEKKGCDETLGYFVAYLLRNFLDAIKQIEEGDSGDERSTGE